MKELLCLLAPPIEPTHTPRAGIPRLSARRELGGWTLEVDVLVHPACATGDPLPLSDGVYWQVAYARVSTVADLAPKIGELHQRIAEWLVGYYLHREKP